MGKFAYHPELMGFAERIQSSLEFAGIGRFVDYQGIDLEHDCYGVEVDGIKDYAMGQRIMTIMRNAIPEWTFFKCYRADCNDGDFRARLAKTNWDTKEWDRGY
jgi:hypothetical protein